MRRQTHLALTAIAMTAMLGGCDTIRARSRAQDGVRLYKDGQVVEAAAKFEEAQKLDPTIPTIWLDLGFANLAVSQANPHTVAGQFAAGRTIAAFEKYLELRPGEERAVSYLVQTFVDTSRYEDAEKFFRPAIEKSPPDTQALATLGTIASKVGRFDDAAKWYQKRIDAEPNNGDARIALSVLIWDRLKTHSDIGGKDRVELANRGLAALKEARRLQPNSKNAFLYTNLIYRERALAGLNEDAKRADLEMANAYFRIANGSKKKHVEGEPDISDEKFIEDNADKTDALVKAAVDALPPPAPANPAPAPGSKETGGAK